VIRATRLASRVTRLEIRVMWLAIRVIRLAIRVTQIIDRLSRVICFVPKQSTVHLFYERWMIDVEDDLGKRVDSS
jgi:hypothetical protein